jgi:hypothetical protein
MYSSSASSNWDKGPQLLALIDESYAALEIGDQIGIEPIEYDTRYD